MIILWFYNYYILQEACVLNAKTSFRECQQTTLLLFENKNTDVHFVFQILFSL